MIIKDAVEATQQARRIIGNPVRFVPKSGKKQGKYWIIKAVIGTLDDVMVTIKMPEKIIGFDNRYAEAR